MPHSLLTALPVRHGIGAFLCLLILSGARHAVAAQAAPSSGRSGDPAAQDEETLTSLASFGRHFGRTDRVSLPVELSARVNYWDGRDRLVFVQEKNEATYLEIAPQLFEQYPTLPPGTLVRVRGALILKGHFVRVDQIEVVESDVEVIPAAPVRLHELSLGLLWSRRVQTAGLVTEVAHFGQEWFASVSSGDIHFVIHRFDTATPQFWPRMLGQQISVTGTLTCEMDEAGRPTHYVVRTNELDGQPETVPPGETNSDADAPPTALRVAISELSRLPQTPDQPYRIRGVITSVWENQGYLVESRSGHRYVRSRLAIDEGLGRNVDIVVRPEKENGWRAVTFRSRAEAEIPPPHKVSPHAVRPADLPFRGHFEADLVSLSSSGDRHTLTLRDGDVVFAAVVTADDENWQSLQLPGARRVAVSGLAVSPARLRIDVDEDATPLFVVQLSNVRDLEVLSRWWQLSPSMAIAVLGLLAALCTAGMICFAVLWLRVQHADQTNRRLSAELLQRQKMDALGRLAGGVAHDFNNLLVGIASNIELIERDSAIRDGQSRQCLLSAKRCTRQATRLVRSLLGFSRGAELELKPGDLNRAIEESVLLSKSTLGPGIKVTLDLAPDLPECLFDRGQLEQALLNLYFNARDALGNGNGEIRVRTVRILNAHDEPVAMIILSDNGSGMDPETRVRIFEPFFTTKAVGKGTGLGLSLVYGVIQQHGGTIECESEPGIGTVFTITLPSLNAGSNNETIDRPTEAEVPRRSAAETSDALATITSEAVESDAGPAVELYPASPAQEYGWHVLLVDDDYDVRRATRLVLETIGHRVTAAADGLEALGQLQSGLDPDLVVLDLLMPAMSGNETFCMLKVQHPDLPVIVCSGSMSEVEKLDGLCDHSPEACLPKPFELAELRATIRRVMHGRCGETEIARTPELRVAPR